MALPIIPILLAVTALGSGIVQGISSAKNAKAQAETTELNMSAQMNERARQAKKLMSQQKTSFLKSGIYFNNGSPLDVINETYNTMQEDINALQRDKDIKVKNLIRGGKADFISSILDGITSGASTYLSTAGSGK